MARDKHEKEAAALPRKEKPAGKLSKKQQRKLALQEAINIKAGTRQHPEQEDPAAWTTTLLGLYRANPIDSATAAELGLYLLEYGAYRS